MNICLDIETAPLPDEQLTRLMPVFEANRTLKDPVKIDADLAAKEASWRERAALDAKTAQVLCIGLMHDKGFEVIEDKHEFNVMRSFWEYWSTGDTFIGFCIKHFDIPMLVKRSWILGVTVPLDVMEGRYLSHRIIDLQERWCLFSHDRAGESLDAVSKAFGIGQKLGNGADFATLWRDDTKAALAYLRQDLSLTYELAKRLGVISAQPPF